MNFQKFVGTQGWLIFSWQTTVADYDLLLFEQFTVITDTFLDIIFHKKENEET